MQFFLKRVNDKFEYKQYLPNKTRKKKGDPKVIDKEISGLTGEKLLEKVYDTLGRYKDEFNRCKAILIEDDLDLYYSKKLHGDRMMKSILPDVLEGQCRHFFRPLYYELMAFQDDNSEVTE